jgi:hypothetical protein
MNSTGKRVGSFAGTIDEARVWDHARSASEVADSFDDQITAAAGLVGSWNMDEGDGITVGDAAGDDNSGVLYNGTWVDGFAVTPVADRALDLDGDDFVTPRAISIRRTPPVPAPRASRSKRGSVGKERAPGRAPVPEASRARSRS